MSKCVRADVRSRRSTRGARAMSTTSPGCERHAVLAVERQHRIRCRARPIGRSTMRDAAGSTSGRFVSACGASGVRTTASADGCRIGPAGREVVGRRAGGRRDDQAVGLDVRDELAVHVDVDFDHARQRAARDDDVVQREVLGDACAVARDAAREQQPRFRASSRPATRRSSAVNHVRAADLRQEARGARG